MPPLLWHRVFDNRLSFDVWRGVPSGDRAADRRQLARSYATVIKDPLLKGTVEGEFTTASDFAEGALHFTASKTNALAGQATTVSHGWFME